MSAEDRARAEELLRPRMELAAAAKAEYDGKVITLAKATGALGQMLGPLKGIKRAAEKLHQNAAEDGGDMDPTSIKDLLRSTIVVKSYEDADAVVDKIRQEFDVLRVKDRREADARAKQGGYADVLINVRMPNGTLAEIQINTPAMLTAKAGKGAKPVPGAGGHQLYELARVLPDGDPKRAEINAAMRALYDAAFEAAARDFAAHDTKAASDMGAAPESGSPRTGLSSAPSSDALKTLPSGNRAYSSPEKEAKNSVPAGKLSGNRIAPSGDSVVQTRAQGDLFGADDGVADNNRSGAAGAVAGAVPKPEGRGRTDGVPTRSGERDQRAGGTGRDGAAVGRGVGQAAADGVGRQDEDGRSARTRDRSRRGAAVPAGRDIQPKSGRNYRLTDADLTYEGSWARKATRNVEAVELLKKLQAEGRQATVEEQRTLAQFIGWGAGEIANNLFSSKLDKAAEVLEAYDRAAAAFDKRGNRPMVRDVYARHGRDYIEGWHDAMRVRLFADPGLSYYSVREITREQIDKARPDASVRRWIELRDRLKAALTPEEWAEAARSTQYAHYTGKGVVRAMWAAAERFGFKGGSVLEPGAGTGVFPGLMPDGLAANVAYTGIEFDTITGGILTQLNPDERIVVDGYQNVKLPRDFYDLAIGNPPFSQTKILSDPEYAKQALALHDYFFAKTLDRVRPGGLVMFVTSRYTMDKLTDKARAYMADRADLVGAIRLPQTAFKQNAGTDVVTDVLFLRKKVPGEVFDGGKPWGKSVPMKVGGQTFPVNEYYHAHPEMVLGAHSDTGTMQNTDEPQYTVLPPAEDIEAAFAAAVGRLPRDVFKTARGTSGEAAAVREFDFNPKAQKEGNYYVSDAGVLMQREHGAGLPVQGKGAKEIETLKAMVPLRDALKQAHYDQLNGGDWETSLKALQAAYEAFTDVHGAINQSTVRQVRVKVDELDENGDPTGKKIDDVEERRIYPLLRVIQDDPDWTLVSALEKVNEETGATSPSAFLTQRVLGKPEAPKIATPHDALLTVLNDTGAVDVDLIAARMDMDAADVIEALGTAIYRNPEGESWETADQYLSGNVKRKLDAAVVAARSDRRYERNVEALRAAQPAPKTPADINVAIGMNWIPSEVYQRFLLEKAGVQSKVHFSEATRQWIVQFTERVDPWNRAATADWGTEYRHAGELMEHALTGRPVHIEKTVGSGKDAKRVFDPVATEAANAKLAAMQEEFSNWVWTDEDRTDKLVRSYNDTFNTTVPRTFDGRHLTLPGATKTINVFDHVKRGAWRIVQSGNTYLAHAVGSGKAQPLDAKVLTPSGWRLMGDLAPGDAVIAGDGTPTMVEAVFPQGVKEIFRVEFSDGASTECCAEHLWLTQTYCERSAGQRAARLGKDWPSGRGKVRLLSEIAATLKAPHLSAKNHSIPMVGAVQMNARPLPLDPYVMGVLLGDGRFTANSVMLSSADPEIVAEVRARLPQWCELVHRGRVDCLIVWRGAMRYAVGGGMVPTNPVMDAARSLGLIGLCAHEKFIPDNFKWNSAEVRLAVLQGLLDADGGVEGHGTSVRFCTTAPRLAADVTEIVQSLGGTVRRRTKWPAYTYEGVRKIGREAFDLCISLPPDVAPFRLPRKAEAVVPKTRYAPARYITAVVPVGKKPAQCIRVAHPSRLYVTDDFIVTHNTFQMVISAMEQRRLGLIKKPMMIVPNHMLQQFAREWQELYPAARLMVADEHGFHTDNRRRWAARVALSDLDGVVMTHSAFKLLDIDHEFKAKMIDEQLDYLRATLEEVAAEDKYNKKKSPKVKQLEKRIEALEEKLKAGMTAAGKDRNVRFDELGVDFLYVDEAHGYRKLDFGTARQVKGISSAGSASALDLYIKARWLDAKNPGRSLVMASGTPVTNTLAELYTVQRFMQRKALEERGIEDFDSWAAMFGRATTSLEPTAAGKYEPVTRFGKFVNVGELTLMFREFADVVTGNELAALLGDKRPKVQGGGRKIVVTPKTMEYAAFQKVLAARYEASRAWKPSKEEPNNPDPVIAIIGDGRLAAIDMRFINPRLQSDPNSKLNRMIDDVVREFKETAGMTFTDKNTGAVEPAQGATMMVFSDLGFGASVAATRGFSARAWMEKRLRDAGIPAAQVAFMGDYKKSADKLKLFRDLNAGRVRILIGSSKNMGTGVNAQQRLLSLFHLDSPWYPADLEQREGRIIRQGNKNKEVRIHAYAAKGSYDETMWGMLARKQFFIEQALSGDGSVREVEDVDSVSQMDMAAALVAEDPRVLELAGLKAEAEKLQRLYRAHEDQRMRFRSDFDRARTEVDALRHRLPAAEVAAAKAGDLSGDRFTAKVGKETFTKRIEWGQALKEAAGRLAASHATSQDIGMIGGFPVRFVSAKTSSSYEWRVDLDTGGLVATTLVQSGAESEVGMATRAVNAVADVARAPGRIRERIVQAEATMDAVRTRLETPFPMAGMLADKLKEAARLEAEIAAATKDRTWRVERIDTGLGFDVQANSAENAIEKAIASNGGTPADWRAVEEPKPSDPDNGAQARLSRGAGGGGMDIGALRSVVDRVLAALPGMPQVSVLASPADAPAGLRDFIERRGATADVEGALYEGRIYLFASGLADAARAEFVLAEHEVAHAGLRGLLGADLKPAMQALHNQSADVRRLAAPLIRSGIPLVEAVEEVIVDIPSAALARLKGWRAVVGRVRDALARVGMTRAAAMIDQWLAGHLTQQQMADLAVADLVRAARAWAARKPGRRAAADSAAALSTGTLADDLKAQETWLTEQAKAAGFASIDELLENDYPKFEALAAQWRDEHHAEALLSVSGKTDPYARAVAAWEAALARAQIGRGGEAPAGVSVSMPLPSVLLAMGVKARGLDMPLRYLQGVIGKHRDLPPGVLRALPQLLSDPVAVFQHRSGGLRVVLDVRTANGEPVVAGVSMDGRIQTVTPLHNEPEASGAERLARMLESELARAGAKVYAREKEALSELRAPRGIGNGPASAQSLAVSSARAVPAIRALHRASRDAAIVMLREGAVRRVGEFGPGVRLSRATRPGTTPGATATERAEALIQQSAATPRPLDAVARGITKAVFLDRLAAVAYGKGAQLIDRLTPERVKAGVIADYGVPEAVIDQRARLQGSQREQLKQVGPMLEKLATMTRAESRVAYEWMTGEDTRTADDLMKALPEESVAVLRQVRDLIDNLSKEAVRLGQLDPEAFKRHRFAYLRRSYFKHEALDASEQTKGERARKERALTILGDQYKGRGMVAKAPMRQIQNIAPEWWQRKLAGGKADTALKGEKFERLERRAPRGEGTIDLDGIGTDGRPGRLLEVHYWPAGEPKPAKYADWNSAGTWEVRDTRGGDAIMWRDFTKEERTRMGEIDEARYAIGKTLHRMIHDVEVGRYLEWLDRGYAKKPGEVIPGRIVDASERYLDTFKADDWVQVPDAKVPGTSVAKYGALAGRYLPGPVWNDLRQIVNGTRIGPEWYQTMLRWWKTSKTALSPGVHTNNVMSNFVMADWHDVTAGHVAKAMRIILGASERKGEGVLGRVGNAAARAGIADAEAAREVVSRYQTSGGAIGSWVTQEISKEQMEPIIQALQDELARAATPQTVGAEVGVYAALQHMLQFRFPQALEAFTASRPAKAIVKDGQNLIDLYQMEDDVFRLAAWLKAKEEGKTDAEAGKVARRSFIDYSINAPWIAGMRASVFPFISFTYRAIPMLLDVAGKRPHKLFKLMAIAGMLNALGWALGGGGGDDEEKKNRKLLPEEKAGRVWGIVPKLIRMPWNDQHASPVYLDIRRWIPVGDVVDVSQGQAALPLPPAAYPGGPLVIMGEILANKSMFTGQRITLETDTAGEQTAKVLDHLWKSFAPNLVGVPGTYATQGVVGALKGRTDAFGREFSPAQSILSAFGVKVGSYPDDVLRRNLLAKRAAEVSELDKNIGQLRRQLQTNRISEDEFAQALAREHEKKMELIGKYAEKLN